MRLAKVLENAREQRGAAVMGILNVTPDSFSDGGLYRDAESSQRRVEELLAEGADIIDIGGESTRPGAAPVAAAEQVRRIAPAVRRALALGAAVSVDTTSVEVAEALMSEGAEIINDVSGLEEPELAAVVAKYNGALVLMHSRGTLAQQRMQGFSEQPMHAYTDIVADVTAEWNQARERALTFGLEPARLFFDPGLGFAKNAEHSWELLTRLEEFSRLGVPIVIGASRKSFIASLDSSAPMDRLGGSLACALLAVQRGAAIVRVHDVKPVIQALAAMRRCDPAYRSRHAG